MCYEYLEVYERLLENQKAQTTTANLVVGQKDLQIKLLEKRVANLDQDGFFYKLWKAIRFLAVAAAGFLIGTSI